MVSELRGECPAVAFDTNVCETYLIPVISSRVVVGPTDVVFPDINESQWPRLTLM